jgi:hypothetical protein
MSNKGLFRPPCPLSEYCDIGLTVDHKDSPTDTGSQKLEVLKAFPQLQMI